MVDAAELDPSEIARIADQVPVRASATFDVDGYVERACAVLNLLNIEARPSLGGIDFGPNGVEPQDQALVFAVTNLVSRRFGVPEQA